MPKLGSSKDKILRQFLTDQSELNIKRATFSALTAMSGVTDKAGERAIQSAWKKYVNAEFGLVEVEAAYEDRMQQEYAKIKNLKPIAKIGEKGLIIEGLT